MTEVTGILTGKMPSEYEKKSWSWFRLSTRICKLLHTVFLTEPSHHGDLVCCAISLSVLRVAKHKLC